MPSPAPWARSTALPRPSPSGVSRSAESALGSWVIEIVSRSSGIGHERTRARRARERSLHPAQGRGAPRRRLGGRIEAAVLAEVRLQGVDGEVARALVGGEQEVGERAAGGLVPAREARARGLDQQALSR